MPPRKLGKHHPSAMLLETDTIVAIATPPGRGAIGIVRLSGPEALTLATPLLELSKPLTPGRPRLVSLLDPATRQPLDQALVTFFAAPRSFTTQHVLELACHGAPVLLDFLVRTLVVRGARLAQPGEFTQRAFLAGRIDLTQAEAIHDLVAATTLHQARTAAAQLGGSLSRAIAPAKHSLVALIAQLEAGVDFVEDDLDLLPPEAILTQLEAIHRPLAVLAATFPAGHLLRTGFTLALVGRPNAGKSSLFNALLGRPRAIVTAQPGTTRDPIAEPLSLDGIPLTLLDTAGLRDLPATPETEAELAGITRSRAALAESDLVLLVIDSTHPPNPEDAVTLATLSGRPHLVAHTKADLAPASPDLPAGHLRVSALTGAGLPALRQAILAAVGANPDLDSPLTTIRQQTTVENALTAIAKARSAAHAQLPHELLLLDLYATLAALDELTGATTPNDILNKIFSSFCIGK